MLIKSQCLYLQYHHLTIHFLKGGIRFRTITSPHQSTHHSTKTLITSCYNIFTMHNSHNFNTPQSVFSHYPPFINTHSGILSMASATFISYMGINSYSTSINMNFELSSFGSITYTINCNNHHKYFKHIESKKG